MTPSEENNPAADPTTGAQTTTTGAETTATVIVTDPNKPVTEGVTQSVGSSAVEGTATGTDLAIVDFGADVGKGLENVTADEFTIPFIAVVALNSPQINPTHQKYIPGAQAGMLFKTSTGETFPALPPSLGVPFIPVKRDHYYAEFHPRDNGGGFLGVKSPTDPEVLKLKAAQGGFTVLKTDRGTELTEIRSLYGVFPINEYYVFRAILGFKSTQMKKYQGFMEIANGIRYPDGKGGWMKDPPPLWAHKWILTTGPEKNKKGDFIGINLKLANGATGRWADPANPEDKTPGPRPALIRPNDPLYIMAREFNASIESGRVKADHEGAAKAGATGGGVDDDIPF